MMADPTLASSGHPGLQVLLLPGAVLPAELTYHNLLAELAGDADARAKDLELYASETPPADYSLDTEVRGVLRFADRAGFDRFHLVGYSAGGASALAFTATNPDRVLSLALLEPAWAGNDGLSPGELDLRQSFRSLAGLPPQEFMSAFVRYQLKPGVTPPPAPEGPMPPWMLKRPAGISALTRAFDEEHLDLASLRSFARPVYFALGGLSNPDFYARMADRLRRVFPDFTVETFSERHHFDPPHRVEAARLASALRRLWRRAESLGPV